MILQERRAHQRNLVKPKVEVNGGQSYRGGVLRDMSVGGVAVEYSNCAAPDGPPLEVGQVLVLNISGKTGMPCRIVRIFYNGFASKFDFTLSAQDRRTTARQTPARPDAVVRTPTD